MFSVTPAVDAKLEVTSCRRMSELGGVGGGVLALGSQSFYSYNSGSQTVNFLVTGTCAP